MTKPTLMNPTARPAQLLYQARDQSKRGVLTDVAGDRRLAKISRRPCEIGLEGTPALFIPGPCKHWIKVKNPDAPWKKRLEEI